MASLLWRSMNFEKILGGIAILLIRHDKLRHGMAALRGGVGGLSAEGSDGNVRQVPVLLQRSGRALDDELVEGQDVEL
jgi:hypothetical protein